MKHLSGFLLTLVLTLASMSVVADGASTVTNDSANIPKSTTYQIRNLKLQNLLRPLDANRANGTPIVLYPAQPWKCMSWKLESAGESGFLVQNLFTSKTFTAKAASGKQPMSVIQVSLSKDPSVASPIWQFARLTDGHYKIVDPQSKAVLTAVQADDGYSFRIIVEAWKDRDDQKWILEEIDPKQLTM